MWLCKIVSAIFVIICIVKFPSRHIHVTLANDSIILLLTNFNKADVNLNFFIHLGLVSKQKE